MLLMNALSEKDNYQEENREKKRRKGGKGRGRMQEGDERRERKGGLLIGLSILVLFSLTFLRVARKRNERGGRIFRSHFSLRTREKKHDEP